MPPAPHCTKPKGRRLGPRLAIGGTVVCGIAMVVGFLVGVALNFFADPENPPAVYGKVFAGVLILFVVGSIAIVAGIVLILGGGKENAPAPVKTRPKVQPDLGDDDQGVADGSTTPDPPAGDTTQSWDEAFDASRRRRQ